MLGEIRDDCDLRREQGHPLDMKTPLGSLEGRLEEAQGDWGGEGLERGFGWGKVPGLGFRDRRGPREKCTTLGRLPLTPIQKNSLSHFFSLSN